MEPVSCAVCGESASEIVSNAREITIHLAFLRRFHRRRLRAGVPEEALDERARFTQDETTNIAACRQCGLLYRNPRPTVEETERDYASDTYGDRIESLFASQIEMARPKARLLARYLPPGSGVVEVGSFVGGFLAAGKERGWRLLGVDPGEEVTAFCRKKALPVFRGVLPEATSAIEEFGKVDAVVIWNTFDQLPDPAPTIDAVRRIVRDGGLLAIRVPNGACFRRTSALHDRLRHSNRLARFAAGWILTVMAWNNLLAFPYLNGYSTRTLDLLLHRYGFIRERVNPDVLCRLSDEQTKVWAAAEERCIKGMLRLAAGLSGLRSGADYSLAPWIDAIYRRAG